MQPKLHSDLLIQPIESKEQLNAFLEQSDVREYAQLFQTWEWGVFQASLGCPIHRLGVFEDGEVVATVLLIETPDRFGRFLYGPRGPVTDYASHARAETVLRLLAHVGRRLSPAGSCLRLDPAIPAGLPKTTAFKSAGYRPAPRFIQVERAWMVDLQSSHEKQIEWQKAHGMRSNLPRYLRRAERAGVTVRASDRVEDLEVFLDMLYHLDNRKNGIGVHPRRYYEQQFHALAPSGYERIYIAELSGEPLAAALIGLYGHEASYLWGASYDRHQDLRAPRLLHFRIMRDAFDQGYRRYNFWGVVRDENHHPGYKGYGYSEFKRSFGGYVQLYLRTQDFVYRPLRYAVAWVNDKRRLHSWQLD